MRGLGLCQSRQFFGRQIERIGGQRAVGSCFLSRGFLAVLEVVRNVAKALFGRACDGAVEDHHVLGREVIEEGDEAILEKREPVLHARQAAPVADRLVERVGGGVRAEEFAVAGAEALDAGLVDQRLARRHEEVLLDRAGRALGVGVEEAQCFQLIAEEVETKPGIEARGHDVEDRAAHREFTRVDGGVGALVALTAQERDQAFVADLEARLQKLHRFADAERG